MTAIPNGYAKQEVMDRQYTYNDLGMISESEITPHRRFISSSSKLTTTFTYDGLMRLENATTSISNIAISGPEPGTPPVTYQTYNGTLYDVDMEYSSGGRVLSKDSNPNSAMAAIADGNLEYDYTVSYGGQSDHQVKSISEVTASGTATSNFTYNLSGSITSIERTLGASTKGSIDYVWNEDQWLVADSNDLGIHHYVYDYMGERIMKSSFEVYSAWINDDLIQSTATLQSYTVYANPYEVISYYDDNGTMEDINSYHYYMGMQRVASGRFADQVQQGMSSKMEGSSSSTNELSEPDPVITQFIGILNEFGYHEGEDFTREELETMESLSNVYPEYSSSTNKTGTSTDDQSDPNLTQEGLNEGPIEEFCEGVETKVYWYHPNYLGSVDLITDIYGEVHQYFLYTPWGENMHQYDAQTNGFDSPYRFNGKELDEETGLAYYGARYYDNQLSMWLSVDPMASKSPAITPYAYTHNNPVILVDPNGEFPGLLPYFLACEYMKVQLFGGVASYDVTFNSNLGVAVGGAAYKIGGGFAFDSHGNFAMYSQEAAFADLFTVLGGPSAGGNAETGDYVMGGGVSVEAEINYDYGYDHVLQLAGESGSFDIEGSVYKAVSLNGGANHDADGNNTGFNIGVGTGFGTPVSLSRINVNTTVMAFHYSDVASMYSTHQAFSNYLDENVDNLSDYSIGLGFTVLNNGDVGLIWEARGTLDNGAQFIQKWATGVTFRFLNENAAATLKTIESY